MRDERHVKAAAVLLSLFVMAGCGMNRTAKGGLIGAGAGGAIGGIIGKQAGNTTVGAILGAAVGGAAGASIGRYMDKQAAELQNDLKNARVERVGEGIKITFNSGILFDTNSSNLREAAVQNLDELAKTLNKYKDTNVLIQGHTDSAGTSTYNQQLSESRAHSVAYHLTEEGVNSGRIETSGKGEQDPVADNSTEAGRQANRRVEVAIMANEKLKKAAEQQKI